MAAKVPMATGVRWNSAVSEPSRKVRSATSIWSTSQAEAITAKSRRWWPVIGRRSRRPTMFAPGCWQGVGHATGAGRPNSRAAVRQPTFSSTSGVSPMAPRSSTLWRMARNG